MASKTILFICTENAGRSQMAEGFAKFYGAGNVIAYSAGTKPAAQINPVVVMAMKEKKIDLGQNRPKELSKFINLKIDYAVTMGCGGTCPFIPGATMIDWSLTDPKGQPLEKVRLIRDEIEQKILELLKEIK